MTEFISLNTNQWSLHVDGIDAFLVQGIINLMLSKDSEEQFVTIKLVNAKGSDQNKRINEWLHDPVRKDAVLNFTDVAGNICQQWKFQVKPERLRFEYLNYNDHHPILTYLDVVISDVVIS